MGETKVHELGHHLGLPVNQDSATELAVWAEANSWIDDVTTIITIAAIIMGADVYWAAISVLGTLCMLIL